MSRTIGSILDHPSLPQLEAEILLAHSLGLKRIKLYADRQRILTQDELAKYNGLIQRRADHEPIAYITGTQPFVSLDIHLDRSVLIPRPETEEMAEKIIDLAKNMTVPPSVADIGTGSGCLAVCLAKFLPQARVIGIDSSSEAIKIAQKNAQYHQVNDRCSFLRGNLLEPLKEKVDIIVSNPPYIPSPEIEKLEKDVKDWEPREALDGGPDGLSCIRKLIKEAPDRLSPQSPYGYLILEFGIDQADRIRKLAQKGFKKIKIERDRQGKERFFFGRK